MTVYTDLLATPVTAAMGIPLGYGDWRFVVQIANTSDGAPLGAFVLGTSVLGGPRWLDVTDSVHGVSITRGGPSGSDPLPGEMAIRLDNIDRQFSPFQSPWHAPGTLARVVVGDGVTTIPIFSGITQSWNESSEGTGRYHWADLMIWGTSYLLANIEDPELASPVGAGEDIFERFDRILTAADWQFDATYTATTPTSAFTLQGTVFGGDLMSELRTVTDSIDYHVVSGKDGNLEIRDREWFWMDASIRDLGVDVPFAADSLQTENDDLLLLADYSAGRNFGTPTTFTNSGIASRYQKRSASKTDLVTIDPGAGEDLIYLASRVLGRGDVTYRPASILLDTAYEDAVWEFVLNADIGYLVNIVDETSGVRFAGYSIAQLKHDITPLRGAGVRWTSSVTFAVESGSQWAIESGSLWGSAKWGTGVWS